MCACACACVKACGVGAQGACVFLFLSYSNRYYPCDFLVTIEHCHFLKKKS